MSRSLLKLMSIKSVMPSSHFILSCPLLLLPSIFPSLMVFSSESPLCIRWSKYWSFSFSISPFNEYPENGYLCQNLLESLKDDWKQPMGFTNKESLLIGLKLASECQWAEETISTYLDRCSHRVQRRGYLLINFYCVDRRRQWHPTPVLLPGKSMDGGAWWAAVHGVAKSWTRLSDFPFTFHFHALEKEMAAHSSDLAWRIPGMGEPGGLPSMGLHRVRHDWSDLAALYGCESWTVKKAEHWRIDYLNCGVGEDSWEFFGLQEDPTSPS